MIGREFILNEIRRLTSKNGGVVPGKRVFVNETGITEGQWSGRYWARWGDAIRDAGLEANSLTPKMDDDDILKKVSLLALELGKFPTSPEMRLKRRIDAEFPNDKTITNHFKSKSGLVDALQKFALAHGEFAAILDLLPSARANKGIVVEPANKIGWVYLLSYGRGRYKIGFSYSVEQRYVTLNGHSPDEIEIVWKIRTDDPVGIEKYWQNRFALQCIRKEYYELSKQDVAAFKRWRKIY